MDTEPTTPPETSSSAPPSGGAPIPQASPLTAFGRLDAFDVESDEWPQYEERMFCYFEENGITDEVRMRAIFLSTVGARTYTSYFAVWWHPPSQEANHFVTCSGHYPTIMRPSHPSPSRGCVSTPGIDSPVTPCQTMCPR